MPRLVALTVIASLLAATLAVAQSKGKPKDPTSWGGWIADVERPAESKKKGPAIKSRCQQPGASRPSSC